MQNADILALANLRVDGREHSQLREVKCKLNISLNADGSVYFEQGLNKVLVNVHGPMEPQRRVDSSIDRGFISCQLRMAPYSAMDWKLRKPGDRRVQEIQNLIVATFQEVVLLDLYKKSEIRIVVHVMESDGSLICSIINAVSLALMDAGVSMMDMVTSCSSGLIHDKHYIDLNRAEQFAGGSYLPIAICTRSKKVIYAALDKNINIAKLEGLMNSAIEGCCKLGKDFEARMKESVQNRISSQIS